MIPILSTKWLKLWSLMFCKVRCIERANSTKRAKCFQRVNISSSSCVIQVDRSMSQKGRKRGTRGNERRFAFHQETKWKRLKLCAFWPRDYVGTVLWVVGWYWVHWQPCRSIRSFWSWSCRRTGSDRATAHLKYEIQFAIRHRLRNVQMSNLPHQNPRWLRWGSADIRVLGCWPSLLNRILHSIEHTSPINCCIC